MNAPVFLTNIRRLAPAFTLEQSNSLDWLACAHARSDATRAQQEGTVIDEAAQRDQLSELLRRVACGADKIGYRGVELADCTHTRWDEMEIYRLLEHPEGVGMLARSRAYAAATTDVLSRFYAATETPPSELVHVTCTGYTSPSGLQRLVASRGWGQRTRVTHAYQMGCYASFPAIRIAAGLSLLPHGLRPGAADSRVDVLHTEFCSLHLNPQLHTPEQLVIQSLFADGFVAYGISSAPTLTPGEPGFCVLALAEELVPNSTEAMQWVCADWGMRMTLARDVPERLMAPLSDFVSRLSQRALLGRGELDRAWFAVHPGGPRILDFAQGILGISDERIAHSRRVLFSHGNMSSATLPHVWMYQLEDPSVQEGDIVMSLAFGPGLTVSGSVMRKIAA